MRRIPPGLLHIMDGDRELCHALRPETLPWLRRELGASFRIEPEWLRRIRRLSLLVAAAMPVCNTASR